MARTFVRPETDIKTLDTFDDQVSAGSSMETTTWNIEQFLGGVISQINRAFNTATSGKNWYDDLSTPSTFEGGAPRGLNDLNQNLHDFEHKRVLRTDTILVNISVPSSVRATGTLTGSSNFADGETVVIGSTTYTFKDTLGTAFDVKVGTDLETSLGNLKAAINLEAGSGTKYGTGTTIHPTVSCTASDATTLSARAKKYGTQGNLIATTETAANAAWGASTLTGGTGDLVILGAGELPTQTTAAVGAVSTLGTVVAYTANFGKAVLTEVAGTTAVSPKNLCQIVDTNNDPILANGKEVWALLQSETATDGHTITDATPYRVQLSFVVLNDTGTDLELVDGQYTGGKTIKFACTERVYLLGLNEQDFLRGAAVDIGAGSVDVTRQNAYDNQGSTAVSLVGYSATLDIGTVGNYWQVRDNLGASLLKVTDNTGTDATTIAIGTGVDYLDVDAVDNNFLNGIKADTGSSGTTINVGVTANQIDCGGALTVASGGSGDLKASAAAQLALADQWKAGSTYSSDLVLADSSAEWSAFETAFGEVSILNAIVAAKSGDVRNRAVAHVTAAISADSLIKGPSLSSPNISADLVDYRNHTFATDVEVYINGRLMRNGTDASSNFDVYPSTVSGEKQYGAFYAEFALKASPGNPDTIQMFINGAL